MTILITGGAGFIGRNITKKLIEKIPDEHIIVIDITKLNDFENIRNITFVVGDSLNFEFIKKILIENSVEKIIHLVGLPVIKICKENPYLSFKLNSESTMVIAEAARLADIEEVIFASSATVYGNPQKNPVSESSPPNPTNVYGYHKLIAEMILKAYYIQYGIPSTVFRIFNVFGNNPYQGRDVISIFLRKALNNEKILVIDPNKFRDFIHVKYVADAFTNSIRRKNNCFDIINLGSGQPIRIIQIVDILQKIMPIEYDIKETVENGTGYYADASKLYHELNIKVSNPLEDIEGYFKKFLKTT